MTSLQIVLATASILSILYVGLGINIVRMRYITRVSLGDGAGVPGKESLLIAVRMHGNFAEHVPLCLVLLAGIAYAGVSHVLIASLCGTLILARILHPIGMRMNAPNLPRGGGIILTWMIMLIASIAGLVAVL